MRLFKSWLLAMIIFVWVVAFLSLLATGLEVPTALTTAHSPHVNQETNTDWHPLEAIYLAVPAEEVDKHPVNADLLSALLLLAVSFGRSSYGHSRTAGGTGLFASWASVGRSSAPSRIDPSWACSGCKGFAAPPT